LLLKNSENSAHSNDIVNRSQVIKYYINRVSMTTGNTGNLLEFEMPPGNTGNILEFN